LLARLLVDVRRAVDRKFLNSRRQRNRATNLGTRALRRVDDLASGRVEDAMVKRLKPNANVLTVHLVFLAKNGLRRACRRAAPKVKSYFTILATTPEPTVRPPSRIAKRSFSSMAIGTIRLTVMFTLSPGITISVPSGSVTIPVTSVVRK